MIVGSKSAAFRNLRLITAAQKPFSYDYKEIKRLEIEVKKKLQVLRMFTDLKEFDYEQPNMTYDKKTGEVKIQGKHDNTKKRLINNVNDLEKEKKALFAELGLDGEGKPKSEKEPFDKTAEKLKKVHERILSEFDIDPTNFYVFSRDMMRVDIGLLIQRPPIFMTMRPRDVEFLKFKSDIMQEFYCNTKQFADEFEEVSKLNEDVLSDNPYSSKMNLDNYPTHKIVDRETG